MNHEEFEAKLKEFNINIDIKHSNGETDFYLELNNIRVTTTDYKFFGYVCGGAYAPCSRTNQEVFNIEDVNKAIKKAIEIQQKYSEHLDKQIDYHDVRDYLKSYGKSKIDKESIKRVLAILNDNYQDLYYKRERIQKNK
jgi:hypothetical protein